MLNVNVLYRSSLHLLLLLKKEADTTVDFTPQMIIMTVCPANKQKKGAVLSFNY